MSGFWNVDENLDRKTEYLDETLVNTTKDKYKEIKRKSMTKTKQKVNGRLYPGKSIKIRQFQEGAKVVAYAIAGVVLSGSIIKTTIDHETLDLYNKTIGSQVTERLTDEFDEMSYASYVRENKPKFFDQLEENEEILGQIEEEKEKLRETGDYKFFDHNILKDDAINNVATTNVERLMNEYYEGGNGYGK